MSLFAYNPCIEERIINFVRTEAPVNTVKVARRFQMPIFEADKIICEMVSAKMLRRVWKNIESDFWNAEELFDLWQ